MKIIFLSVLSTLILGQIKCQDMLCCYAKSGLVLHEKPDIKSLGIDTIPFGNEVLFLDSVSKIPDFEYEGIKGAWLKVQYGDNDGYIFGGLFSDFKINGQFNINCHYYDSLIQNYIKNNDSIISKPDTIIVSNHDGEGFHRKIRYHLASGDTYEFHTYWEAHEAKLITKQLSIYDALNIIRAASYYCKEFVQDLDSSMIFLKNENEDLYKVKCKHCYDFEVTKKEDCIVISLVWSI
jgi:hypothetical protein